MRRFISLLVLLLLVAAATFLLSCGSSSNNSMQMATVQVSLSDPATCSAPQGHSATFMSPSPTSAFTRVRAHRILTPVGSIWLRVWPAVRCR